MKMKNQMGQNTGKCLWYEDDIKHSHLLHHCVAIFVVSVYKLDLAFSQAYSILADVSIPVLTGADLLYSIIKLK